MMFHSGNTQVISAIITVDTNIKEEPKEKEVKPKAEIKKKGSKKKVNSGKN